MWENSLRCAAAVAPFRSHSGFAGLLAAFLGLDHHLGQASGHLVEVTLSLPSQTWMSGKFDRSFLKLVLRHLFLSMLMLEAPVQVQQSCGKQVPRSPTDQQGGVQQGVPVRL